MFGILLDVTKCTGCERCVDACVDACGRDPVAAAADRATTEDGLSADRPCSVLLVDEGRFARKSCMHCVEPACASACLVGAIRKTPEGPVVYDPDCCIGCRYCMLACPFHIPRYEWRETMPFVQKCTMCFDRIRTGGRPACVEACPAEALVFGRREELLATAHDRIRRQPDLYLPRVWGETEWGGTSVLYISDVDLAPVGWPEQAVSPIPSLTEPLIRKTPAIGTAVAFGTWALSAIIRRRQRLMGQDGRRDRAETANED